MPGNVPEQSSTAEIGRLIARCLANYGERRGIDMRMVTAEWHDTLGAYPFKRLNDALSEHIRKSTFWPTVANLVEIMRAETPAPGLPLFRKPEEPFARDGRNEAEEIIFRVAQSKRWKDEAAAAAPKYQDPLDVIREVKPASQDMTVSKALLRTCAARRSRRLPTCSDSCSKTNCDLKDCEE